MKIQPAKIALNEGEILHESKTPLQSMNKKYGSQKANQLEKEIQNEEIFVTMDMRRKDDIDQRLENPVTERTIHKESQHVQQDDRSSQPNYKFVILVIACNRPTVKRCLDKLLEHRLSDEKFPIVVSQDCGHEETASVIRSYGNQVHFIQQPDLGPVKGVPANMMHFMGYYKISRHFKFALTHVFDVLKYETVIIVEDDLDIGKKILYPLVF